MINYFSFPSERLRHEASGNNNHNERLKKHFKKVLTTTERNDKI